MIICARLQGRSALGAARRGTSARSSLTSSSTPVRNSWQRWLQLERLPVLSGLSQCSGLIVRLCAAAVKYLKKCGIPIKEVSIHVHSHGDRLVLLVVTSWVSQSPTVLCHLCRARCQRTRRGGDCSACCCDGRNAGCLIVCSRCHADTALMKLALAASVHVGLAVRQLIVGAAVHAGFSGTEAQQPICSSLQQRWTVRNVVRAQPTFSALAAGCNS